MEIWRRVPSVPDYMACSDGRLMRVPYNASMPNGGLRQYGGQPTWGVWNKQEGRFQLHYKGKNYKVAQLVCEAFHGEKPTPESVCMHIDENAANNAATNLAWGTQKENMNAPGYKAYRAKLSKRRWHGNSAEIGPMRSADYAKAAE